jgi:hypothetical protein
MIYLIVIKIPRLNSFREVNATQKANDVLVNLKTHKLYLS